MARRVRNSSGWPALEAPKAVEVSRSLLAGRAQEIQDHHPERTGLTADRAVAVSSVPTLIASWPLRVFYPAWRSEPAS
jgi:hypothetical protein